jgi:hypothetical protein
MARRYVVTELQDGDPNFEKPAPGMALRTKAGLAVLALVLVLIHGCGGAAAPGHAATTVPSATTTRH